jgi:hypothetical protein
MNNVNSWNELYKTLTSHLDYVKPNLAASEEQISKVEKSLKIKLPSDLKDLLLELNGDNWLIFSAEQIIDINLSVRKLGCFMPLDCFLFFAGNGSGDYYGFPITKEDGVRDDSVFIWEHETDSRIWKAGSLKDAIIKYYNDEI